MVAPRLRDVLLHRNVATAGVIGVAAGLAGHTRLLPAPLVASPSVADVVGSALSVTGFGFAISLTAVSVVLVIPFGRAAALMVVNEPGMPSAQVIERDGRMVLAGPHAEARANALAAGTLRRSGFLDLVFIFLWTALANLLASVAIVGWGVALGGSAVLAPATAAEAWVQGFVLAVAAYAVLQMVSALASVYGLARVVQGSYQSAVLPPDARPGSPATDEHR